MEYGNAAIVSMAVFVVLAVLALAFAGLYGLDKTIDESAP
jgi:Mn2+/Fe2+ NRAMP family transporter